MVGIRCAARRTVQEISRKWRGLSWLSLESRAGLTKKIAEMDFHRQSWASQEEFLRSMLKEISTAASMAGGKVLADEGADPSPKNGRPSVGLHRSHGRGGAVASTAGHESRGWSCGSEGRAASARPFRKKAQSTSGACEATDAGHASIAFTPAPFLPVQVCGQMSNVELHRSPSNSSA